jgi:hypothetical protein
VFFCVEISVMAACAVANIVKSSLGPVGLDKMMVDDVGVRNMINILVVLEDNYLLKKRSSLTNLSVWY